MPIQFVPMPNFHTKRLIINAIESTDEPALVTLRSDCLWNFMEENTSAEIGYELLPDHQGKGIMQEALVNILDFVGNILQLQQIEAYIHQDNTASRRLVERNGFYLDPVRTDENHEQNLIYIRTRA